MPVEVAIVLIVAIIAISRVSRERYRARNRELSFRAEQQPMLSSPRVSELEREVADLRKRLEVLERIATEDRKTRQLADEIDRLR